MIAWDTSALVRAYLPEPQQARVAGMLRSSERHGGSTLLRPEAVSAIVRRAGHDRPRRRAGLAVLGAHVSHFVLVPVDDAQIASAITLIERHALRAADALHVAAAQSLAQALGRRRLRFVTADGPQAAAARAEGLTTILLDT